MEHSESVFLSLKHILAPYACGLVVVTDDPEHFYINTHHVMPNNQPMYFGSCKIGKRYVSYHLMPVYVFPELLEDISPALKKRMQGKSCFNFTKVDTELFDKLKTLTQTGYKAYEKAGYL